MTWTDDLEKWLTESTIGSWITALVGAGDYIPEKRRLEMAEEGQPVEEALQSAGEAVSGAADVVSAASEGTSKTLRLMPYLIGGAIIAALALAVAYGLAAVATIVVWSRGGVA